MNVLAFLYMHAYFATLILSKPRHNRLIYYIIYTKMFMACTFLRLTSLLELEVAISYNGHRWWAEFWDMSVMYILSL